MHQSLEKTGRICIAAAEGPAGRASTDGTQCKVSRHETPASHPALAGQYLASRERSRTYDDWLRVDGPGNHGCMATSTSPHHLVASMACVRRLD